MKLQKTIFIIIALAVISLSFYFLFSPDLSNPKTILKIVCDKDIDASFYENIKGEFQKNNPNIIIKYIYKDYYEASDYIDDNDDVDAWFITHEDEIESFREYCGWDNNNKKNPILESTIYATSPLVIVGFKDRIDLLGDLTMDKLYDIITNKRTWSQFGGESEWGKISFDHPYVGLYNPGSKFVIMLANNYYNQKGTPKKFITKQDITNTKAKEYITRFEQNIPRKSSDRDYAINDMIRYYEKEPNDMVLIDESVILQNIENASTSWSGLKMIYPNPNLNTNHTFIVLNTSKPSPEKTAAIAKFKELLLSESIQKNVLTFGFRPVNTNISTLIDMEKKYSDFGFKKDLPPSLPYFGRDTFYGASDISIKEND